MDIGGSYALMSMGLRTAQVSQSYGLSVAKKVMDTQEDMAMEVLDMLPATPPAVPKGQFIDVYA